MSFKSLEQGFFALELNWATQELGETVQTEPGLKMVGLGNMLVEYPSTFVTMHFKAGGDRGPVRARSADGLEMRVSVSFQYRLGSSALRDLYFILGDHLYKDEFIRFARAAIVEACTHYTAESFFTNRTVITAMMVETLQVNFDRPEKNLKANIKGLQLGVVDLPDMFESEIQTMMAQQQEIEVAKAERIELTIVKNREMIEAQQKALENVKLANGQAEAIRMNNEAVVKVIKERAKRKALANKLILDQLTDDPDPLLRLLDIMKIRMIEGHEARKMLVNLNMKKTDR